MQVQEHLIRVEEQVYPHGVAEAVLLSLQTVQAADQPGVCRLMEITAVLSAAGVRRDMLHAAGQAGVLAGGGHQVAAAVVDRALAQLAERSLLTFSLDGQTIIVHRLVTRVIRDGVVRHERLTAVCRDAASALERVRGRLQGRGIARPSGTSLSRLRRCWITRPDLRIRPMRSWPEFCCGSGSSRCIT